MLAPLLGLLAGTHHALTGPDHMAGVAPFAAGQGRAAWRVGARWGLGHATGASLAALAALALRARIPGIEERVSGASELVVGGALMLVGALGLRAAIRAGHAQDRHRHGALEHRHWHAVEPHGHAAPGVHPATGPSRHPHAAFWLGTLHGAAGLSHLFAVLPALAFPGWWQPLTYLAGYGAGSLAAITGFTALLGRLLPGNSERVLRLSMGFASAASLIVGAAWIALSL
jgi:hypothetical protein